MSKHHIAQINVAQLAPINALADASPGFVWRPQTEEGKERLNHLREHGDTVYAFSFKNLFRAPEE